MNCQQQRRRRSARTPVQAARRHQPLFPVSPVSPGGSPPREERYAGPKWGAAPSAAALPPPPTHWRREGRCRPEPDRAHGLKLLLNVSATA